MPWGANRQRIDLCDDVGVRFNRDGAFPDLVLELLFVKVQPTLLRGLRGFDVVGPDVLNARGTRQVIRLDEQVVDGFEASHQALLVFSQAGAMLDNPCDGVAGEWEETMRAYLAADESGIGADCLRRPIHVLGELGLDLEQPRKVGNRRRAGLIARLPEVIER